MFEMFNDRIRAQPAVVGVPQWPLIQDHIRQNVQRVKDWYRMNQPGVHNQHPLIRFINSITVPTNIHVERYVDRVAEQSLDTAKAHGYTSLLSNGKAFSNAFYKNTAEFIFCHSSFFDPYAFEQDWENQIPVVPMSHPIVAMDYLQPGLRCVAPIYDYSVVRLDPVKLMLMYRCYCNDRQNKNKDRVTSVHNFIGGYVLPNMLPHHVDITLMNRLSFKLKGVDTQILDTTPKAYQHQFALIDIAYQLDKAFDKIQFNITNSKPSLYKVMKNTPLAFHEDAYALMKEDYITRTVQADWLLALAQLKNIAFLYEVCGDTLMTTNRYEVTNAANALVRNEAARIIVSRAKDKPMMSYKVMGLLGYINEVSQSYRLAAQLK